MAPPGKFRRTDQIGGIAVPPAHARPRRPRRVFPLRRHRRTFIGPHSVLLLYSNNRNPFDPLPTRLERLPKYIHHLSLVVFAEAQQRAARMLNPSIGRARGVLWERPRRLDG